MSCSKRRSSPRRGPRSRLLLAAAALLLLAAACRDRPEADPERESRRLAAAQRLCIAEELLADARDRTATLQLPEDGADAMAPALRAAAGFAQAYREHAEVRYAQSAYADSLVAASTRADSTRLAERARGFALAPGEPATLEANVARAYARDFSARLQNPAHPCNRSAGESP